MFSLNKLITRLAYYHVSEPTTDKQKIAAKKCTKTLLISGREPRGEECANYYKPSLQMPTEGGKHQKIIHRAIKK